MGPLPAITAIAGTAIPFNLPGLQDITAHVDFRRAWAQAAADAGLGVLGFANQARFLPSTCGDYRAARAEDPADANVPSRRRACGRKKLLSPSEMGELFKVLAVGKGVARPLLGFASGDRSYAL
jgi:SAM-dependent MidA family methyltransferase